MDSVKYIKKVPKSKRLTLNLPGFRIGQTIEINIKSPKRGKKSTPFDMEKWAKEWSAPLEADINSGDTELFTTRQF